MRFTVVGHATLFVEGDRTLLVDPWLLSDESRTERTSTADHLRG